MRHNQQLIAAASVADDAVFHYKRDTSTASLIAGAAAGGSMAHQQQQQQQQQQHARSMMSALNGESPATMIWLPRDQLPATTTTTTTTTKRVRAPSSERRATATTTTTTTHVALEGVRRLIESTLQVAVARDMSVDEMGALLSDGVLLCHLLNRLCAPLFISHIHMPSHSTTSTVSAKRQKL